ncbi:hypothetical protein JYU34_004812 [Plutella xylostella]|uniref:Uncharacterized protein n=1 Tax=Plutella xylostella TaxID=51655 RepID=A0ABQ7QYW7_PLUXY|nr:hypothetical protein JYU34_004812 [Plutella xylostella]
MAASTAPAACGCGLVLGAAGGAGSIILLGKMILGRGRTRPLQPLRRTHYNEISVNTFKQLETGHEIQHRNLKLKKSKETYFTFS